VIFFGFKIYITEDTWHGYTASVRENSTEYELIN